MASEMDTPLLSRDFIARLEQLDLVSRKLLAGKLKGERRSRKRGQSIEFADYREYVPGDDLRFIDWNVYGRLERLFLKLFHEEEDLAVYILADMTQSCDYGNPSKARYIQQTSAALAYVGLVNHSRVWVRAFSGDKPAEVGPLRGRNQTWRMLDFVSKLRPQGPSRLEQAFQRFSGEHRQKGICIVLSDFFDKAPVNQWLRWISGQWYELYVIHVLSPQEMTPDVRGDIKLRDMEDHQTTEVSITPAVLSRYTTTLNAYCHELRRQVSAHGGTYILARTDMPYDRLVLEQLRHRGLLG